MWQPLSLQVLTFTWSGDTSIMIYILLGCFPITNKEGGKQVTKLRDWPPRYKTTHVRLCLFSVWHKFSSCSMLSILTKQHLIKDTKGWSAMLGVRKITLLSENAASETALPQNHSTIAQRTWVHLSTESTLRLHLQNLTSVPSEARKPPSASRQLFIQLNMSVYMNCDMHNFPCI